MKGETWVVVANSACARVFKIAKPGAFEEINTPIHPGSRLHMLDLTSDKPGRSFERMGGGKHSMEQETSPKEKEDKLFARELTHFLESAYDEGKLGRLYIAAAPSFLGLIRKMINPNVGKLLVNEINKDLTHMRVDEIQEHFPHAH